MDKENQGIKKKISIEEQIIFQEIDEDIQFNKSKKVNNIIKQSGDEIHLYKPVKINRIQIPLLSTEKKSNNDNDNIKVSFYEGCLQTSNTEILKNEREKEENLKYEYENTVNERNKNYELYISLIQSGKLLLTEREKLIEKLPQKMKYIKQIEDLTNGEIEKSIMYKDLIIAKCERGQNALKKAKEKIEKTKKRKEIVKEEIIKEEKEYKDLIKMEINTNITKKKVSEEIEQLSLNNSKNDRVLKHILDSIEQFKIKKEGHNKNRIEVLSHILILKPYYKKFLILRQKNPNVSNVSFNIQKNRKTLFLSKYENYKFDLIISKFNNLYEQKSLLQNEEQFIGNELFNITFPYLSQFSSSSDDKNFFILYISEFSNLRELNVNLITLAQNLFSHFFGMEFQIKAILEDIFIEICNDDIFDNINCVKNKLCNIDQRVLGYCYSFKKDIGNASFDIINVDYRNNDILNLLVKISESNVGKKKKNTSLSLKNKQMPNKELGIIFNLLNLLNPFHCVAIFDFNNEHLAIKEVKDILLEGGK